MGTKPSGAKGRKYHTCGVCERKALHVTAAVIPFRLRFSGRVFPAGTEVCGDHCDDVLPLEHAYWPLVDATVTRDLLSDWIAELETWIAKGQPENMTPDSWAWECDAPKWLRDELASVQDNELVVLRNTVIDHLMRARGLSIHFQSDAVFAR
jgi:hypothetical protein